MIRTFARSTGLLALAVALAVTTADSTARANEIGRAHV